jgi:hypothetical protein
MARTFFQDFKRDNGDPVTVEYSYAPGSETTYSPLSGACGGDACEVEIVTAWPNTQEYNDLHSRKTDLENFMLGKSVAWLTGADTIREEIAELAKHIDEADEASRLTDAETERMTDWLIEHHVDEPHELEIF